MATKNAIKRAKACACTIPCEREHFFARHRMIVDKKLSNFFTLL